MVSSDLGFARNLVAERFTPKGGGEPYGADFNGVFIFRASSWLFLDRKTLHMQYMFGIILSSAPPDTRKILPQSYFCINLI